MATEPRRGGMGAAVVAAAQAARRSLLRNHGGGHAPVSNLELFFDLVYVFAITQISGFVHHHLDPLGLLEGGILFLAVWWAWMYTTWAANWLNPDRIPVRLLLLALMFLSLAMAVALPRAFGDKGLIFAASYVALQVGRSAVVALMFGSEGANNTTNMWRITVWFGASGLFWIYGGLAGHSAQLICWGIALAIEYVGPIALFPVPGLGHSKLSDWNISGSHMAERCSLFIIIALGEGIVVTGASFAGLPMEMGRVAALVVAFLGSALMWWLYFDLGAERGARMIAGHAQPGRVARNAYTYLHMPIVLGIVICAVADALLLEEWDHAASRSFVAVQIAGLLLFLVGVGLFKRSANSLGNFPFSHLIAVMLIVPLGLWNWWLPMTTSGLSLACTVVLLLTAYQEWISYHGGWVERWEARGWRIGTWARVRNERRRERRLAREAARELGR
ncbi:MAG: low temperature requirement protein A [Novosphingobium sp.]